MLTRRGARLAAQQQQPQPQPPQQQQQHHDDNDSDIDDNVEDDGSDSDREYAAEESSGSSSDDNVDDEVDEEEVDDLAADGAAQPPDNNNVHQQHPTHRTRGAGIDIALESSINERIQQMVNAGMANSDQKWESKFNQLSSIIQSKRQRTGHGPLSPLPANATNNGNSSRRGGGANRSSGRNSNVSDDDGDDITFASLIGSPPPTSTTSSASSTSSSSSDGMSVINRLLGKEAKEKSIIKRVQSIPDLAHIDKSIIKDAKGKYINLHDIKQPDLFNRFTHPQHQQQTISSSTTTMTTITVTPNAALPTDFSDWISNYNILKQLRRVTSMNDTSAADSDAHERAVMSVKRNSSWEAAVMYDAITRKRNCGTNGRWASSIPDDGSMMAVAAINRSHELHISSTPSPASSSSSTRMYTPSPNMISSLDTTRASSSSSSNNRSTSSGPPSGRTKVTPCRNWNNGKCSWSDERCWNLHICNECWPATRVETPAWKHHQRRRFIVTNKNEKSCFHTIDQELNDGDDDDAIITDHHEQQY